MNSSNVTEAKLGDISIPFISFTHVKVADGIAKISLISTLVNDEDWARLHLLNSQFTVNLHIHPDWHRTFLGSELRGYRQIGRVMNFYKKPGLGTALKDENKLSLEFICAEIRATPVVSATIQ